MANFLFWFSGDVFREHEQIKFVAKGDTGFEK